MWRARRFQTGTPPPRRRREPKEDLMQDRMMEEIKQDIAHVEETLARHKKRVRRLSNEAEAAERRRTCGNKR